MGADGMVNWNQWVWYSFCIFIVFCYVLARIRVQEKIIKSDIQLRKWWFESNFWKKNQIIQFKRSWVGIIIRAGILCTILKKYDLKYSRNFSQIFKNIFKYVINYEINFKGTLIKIILVFKY